jgi:hypothetical protein
MTSPIRIDIRNIDDDRDKLLSELIEKLDVKGILTHSVRETLYSMYSNNMKYQLEIKRHRSFDEINHRKYTYSQCEEDYDSGPSSV